MNDQEKLPLNGMRGPLPLSNDDFEAIRANVLSRIENVRRPWLDPFSLRFATATVAVTLVAVLLVVSWPHKTAPPRQAPQHAAAPKAVTTPSISAPAIRPEVVAAAVPPKHVAKRHRPHRAVEPPPVAVAADVHEPMTIELQTSNPDVRIIWITR